MIGRGIDLHLPKPLPPACAQSGRPVRLRTHAYRRARRPECRGYSSAIMEDR